MVHQNGPQWDKYRSTCALLTGTTSTAPHTKPAPACNSPKTVAPQQQRREREMRRQQEREQRRREQEEKRRIEEMERRRKEEEERRRAEEEKRRADREQVGTTPAP